MNPVTLTVGTQYQQAYDIELTIYFGVTDETYQAWQLRVWGQLYDAAKANYEMNRAMLKDQLAALQAQLGAQDALSLRQIEREEVMKNVLRWLFGPAYKFVPPVSRPICTTPGKPSSPRLFGPKCWPRARLSGSYTSPSSGKTCSTCSTLTFGRPRPAGS